jgi:hypothetical protein
MATGTLVSVEEYLSTTHRPDCDYVDGVILERHSGELDHSDWQLQIAACLRARRREFGVYVATCFRHRMFEKIDDYLNFGVKYLCVVNPKLRKGWSYTAKDGLLRTSEL